MLLSQGHGIAAMGHIYSSKDSLVILTFVTRSMLTVNYALQLNWGNLRRVTIIYLTLLFTQLFHV